MMEREEGGTIRRAATVSRWLASIVTLHRIAEVRNPTRDEDVRAARRTVTRGRNIPDQKAPLHWGDVERALNELGHEPRDLRVKALIAVAYSTLARRAELIWIRVEDISYGPEGDGTATLRTKGGGQQERYLVSSSRRHMVCTMERPSPTRRPLNRM